MTHITTSSHRRLIAKNGVAKPRTVQYRATASSMYPFLNTTTIMVKNNIGRLAASALLLALLIMAPQDVSSFATVKLPSSSSLIRQKYHDHRLTSTSTTSSSCRPLRLSSSFLSACSDSSSDDGVAKNGNNDKEEQTTHQKQQYTQDDIMNKQQTTTTTTETRRSILQRVIATSTILSSTLLTTTPTPSLLPSSSVANAAMGTLPEYQDTNAIFQGITLDVNDKSQYEDTIQFFMNGFDGMKILRERGGDGGGVVKDTWLGFGPEILSIPESFTFPVSSFSQYGGHASIHIRYDPKSTKLLYKRSSGEYNNEPAPGDSIAYLQLGVPQYRISQMVKYGGNILDAYGWVNAVCPAGLPIRAIVGIRPDPLMFLAINCADISQSEEFYSKLGFVRQEYPYARLNSGQGQFEPPQPNKSVYLAPSPNSMGVLLLQNKNRKKSVIPNPVLRSMNVVYAPPPGESSSTTDNNNNTPVNIEPQIMDPSSIPVSFIPQDYLEKEIKLTKVSNSESVFVNTVQGKSSGDAIEL